MVSAALLQFREDRVRPNQGHDVGHLVVFWHLDAVPRRGAHACCSVLHRLEHPVLIRDGISQPPEMV